MGSTARFRLSRRATTSIRRSTGASSQRRKSHDPNQSDRSNPSSTRARRVLRANPNQPQPQRESIISNEASTTVISVADRSVKAISAAVGDINSQQLHARYGAQLKSLEAEHKVANAELVAELRAVNERNNFLVDELAKARQDLVAERDARIKIAQAEAGRQGVVVNAGKQ